MSRKNILFIDDNFICSADIAEYLRENGFTVEAVYCAAAAFEAIDRHGRFSALVTDIDLGEGADGFEIARRARAAYPALPVVYISGTAAWRQASEGVSGSEFIAKPFPPVLLVEALDRIIHREAA